MGSRVCQVCGSAQSRQVFAPGHIEDSSVDVNKFSVREDAFYVNERLRHLDNLIDYSAYNKRKCALENEYLKFLGCSSDLEFLFSSPVDICKFLISKDCNRRT